MKNTLFMLAAVVFAASTIGCSDPCGELKDKCGECDNAAACELGADLLDSLGGDDACQEALDGGNVCGDEMTE